MATSSSENAAIAVLGACMFFHIVDFMLIMPLGPTFINEFGLSSQQFSFLVAIYNIAAAVSGLLGLMWMDRFDRKKSLLVVVLCFSIATAACGLVRSYPLLLLTRMLTGAFGGIINALCLTIISDLVPYGRRAFALGKMMMAFSLGSIIGIPAGLMMANHLGWSTPFLAIAGLSVVVALVGWRVLPPIDKHLIQQKTSYLLDDLREILTVPANLRCFLFTACLMLGQFSVIPFIGTVMVQNFGLDHVHLPWVYAVGGTATVLTGPLIGRLADAYSKQVIFVVCALASLVPTVILTHMERGPFWALLVVSTSFFIFTSGRMSPAMALISSMVEGRLRGRFLSFNSAVQQASAGFASALAGMIVSINAQGRVDHFERVGYMAICFGMASIALVLRLWGVPPSSADEASVVSGHKGQRT